MSRIDELIAELCPDGVPHRALDQVVTFQKGEQLKAEDRIDGPYPVVTAGRTNESTHQEFNFGAGSVSVSSHGAYAGHINYWAEPIWLSNNVFVLAPSVPHLESRFLFFALKSRQQRVRDRVRGGGVPYMNARDLAPLRIPVPPLEVQREIVRILDQFTQLEAELEAELEARRRQYEHYRQLAMSFDDSIPRVALGDIAEVRSGWGFPNVHQGREEGEYPFYKVGDMNLPGNETVMSIANNYVSAEVAKQLGVRPAPAGTVIFPKIGAAVATNKKRVLSVPSAYDNNVMGLVPTERVTSRFLYHWMQTFDLSRLANDSGAVPSIRKTEAEKVLIPLPDLDTQREVAGILDKFDALVNDISEGIPAEMEARRQQYEYYRDKLLAFEEKKASEEV